MASLHTCSYYCQGTVHAMQALLPVGSTEADAIACGRAWWGPAFLGVKACPEVDIASWRAQEGWSFPVEDKHQIPWLTMVDVAHDSLPYTEKVARAMAWTADWRAQQERKHGTKPRL